VEHRHLLPDEIDLLLDGEAGFGVQPLRAHARSCAHCRAELEDARAVVSALEHLPHASPSPLFASRVMAQVQVFEPWHVTALDAVKRWIPQSRPVRMLAGASALSAATVLTVATLWVLTQIDVVLFALNLGLDRARTTLYTGLGDAVASTLGEPALAALQSGGPVAAIVLVSALVGGAIAASAGLRALAAVARRRRV
jgi:hypothetical protein